MQEGRNCEVCGIDISDKKASARTCSTKCRKLLFSNRSLEQNGTLNGTETGTPSIILSEPKLEQEIWFEFYTIGRANGMGRPKDEKSPVRKAKYWYDVPSGAVPVSKKGWPEMPDYMNGRQYFLWWKNEFKYSEKFPNSPEIHNPYPIRENVTYVQAGDASRRWGA